ncbi:MAG: NAD(P)H-dependent oxidoreductase [bacterium]|nr:NAD(P)H-dependent oxidoreductase [bacterium]
MIDSPCYCMGMTGALKSFLDHLAYLWLSHRPHPQMFHKVGVVISCAGGAGAKK